MIFACVKRVLLHEPTRKVHLKHKYKVRHLSLTYQIVTRQCGRDDLVLFLFLNAVNQANETRFANLTNPLRHLRSFVRKTLRPKDAPYPK